MASCIGQSPAVMVDRAGYSHVRYSKNGRELSGDAQRPCSVGEKKTPEKKKKEIGARREGSKNLTTEISMSAMCNTESHSMARNDTQLTGDVMHDLTKNITVEKQVPPKQIISASPTACPLRGYGCAGTQKASIVNPQ